MGRKKCVLTSFDLEKREKTAARIKALKESRKDTIKSLALFLGVGEATLRNYTHARTSMDRATAELIAQKTGTIAPYWLGESDAKNWGDYRAEQESAASAGLEEYQALQERENIALRSFFLRCGFNYIDASQDPATAPEYFFGHLQNTGPHILTSVDHPALSASFSHDELEAVLSHIREVVELEVYKRIK